MMADLGSSWGRGTFVSEYSFYFISAINCQPHQSEAGRNSIIIIIIIIVHSPPHWRSSLQNNQGEIPSRLGQEIVMGLITVYFGEMLLQPSIPAGCSICFI